jgi:hypothetical protein
MFEAAGWVLIVTILGTGFQIPSSPGMNIQIEGFKTEESCLKAAEKAKKDIKKQLKDNYAQMESFITSYEYEASEALYMPIAICVKKD